MISTSESTIPCQQALPFQQQMQAIARAVPGNADIGILSGDNTTALNALSRISRFAFDQDFCDFASKTHPCFNILQLLDPAFKSSDDLLNDYDDHFFNHGGLAGFLEKYPLVGKLQQDLLQQIASFTTEVNKNLLIDIGILSQVFNKGEFIGSIAKININQGDQHQNGKSTAIIEFDCGLKLLYKPRSGAMDIACNAFISQVANETGIALKTAKVLDRGEYFWMEFIDHSPVANEEELTQYYTKCGALLAVVFLLGGTDFHFENMIACGKYPVLIDLECLFGATDEMQEEKYTVHNTGLLPANIYLGEQDSPIDNSGFGAWGRQVSGIDCWKWENTGTDALRLDKQKGVFIADKNQPVYEGAAVSPEGYSAELINGFKKVCNWFIANSGKLDTPGSAFSNFKDKPVRVIIRNTMNYLSIIENSLTAAALASEKAREEEIHTSLNDFHTVTHLAPKMKAPVTDAEYKAIKKMNVPLFIGDTTKLHLRESGDSPGWAFFKTTPYQFTLNRIKNFDIARMDAQVGLIRSALVARYGAGLLSHAVLPAKKLTRYNKEEVLHEAKWIASNIKASAIKNNNAYGWNSYTSNGDNKLVYSALSGMLYDGSLGIACFLDQVDGAANREMVDVIIATEVKKAFRSKPDISFSSGLAGLIYALVKTHKADNRNLETAIALTRIIQTEDLLNDDKYDIMAGSAGLLLSLAALYKSTGSADVLELMETIGGYLLESRVMDAPSGALTWQGEHFGRPLTGFSHGASGIGCALVTLYDCTGGEKYKQAFHQSVIFEDKYRNAGRSNWCDLRKAGSDCKTTWCHGAPGIGLARLHAYKILKAPYLLHGIETAIATTQNALLTDIDFYCCGNAGRIDFLIEASVVLGRPKLLKAARKALLTIINRKNTRGYYQTYDTEGVSPENPSLFRGTSGIGYTLLRSINPETIPCLGLLA